MKRKEIMVKLRRDTMCWRVNLTGYVLGRVKSWRRV
jgi:hypothetical protein